MTKAAGGGAAHSKVAAGGRRRRKCELMMSAHRGVEAEELPKVEGDTLGPLMRSFFGRLSAEQWRLLRRGAPDPLTSCLLAELLMNVVTALSRAFLAAPGQTRRRCVSEEQVHGGLGDVLSDSFAQVLGVRRVSSASLVLLKKCVIQEVSETVNSVLRTPPAHAKRHTPPQRLKDTLKYTLALLKSLMRNLCPPPEAQRGRGHNDPKEEEEEREEEPEVAEESFPWERRPAAAAGVRAVQALLSREVSGITEPLLGGVASSVQGLLRRREALDVESAADDIALLMAAGEAADEETHGQDPASQKKAERVKALVAECCARAWMVRLAAQQELRPSEEALLDMANHMLMSGEEDAISSYLAHAHDDGGGDGGTVPESARKQTLRAAPGPSCPHRMVVIFRSLMKWWLETQSGRHVERVTAALRRVEWPPTPAVQEAAEEERPRDAPSETPAQPPAEEAQEETEEERTQEPPPALTREATPPPPPDGAAACGTRRRRRKAVRILVECIVSRTLVKAKVGPQNPEDPQLLARQLFERVWAELEAADFPVGAHTFRGLDKAIFKELCRQKGGAKMLLLALKLQEPLTHSFIAAAVRERAAARAAPRRRGAIGRIVAVLSKALRW